MRQNCLLVPFHGSVFKTEPGVEFYNAYSPLDLWSSVIIQNSWLPEFVGSNYHLTLTLKTRWFYLIGKKDNGIGLMAQWVSTRRAQIPGTHTKLEVYLQFQCSYGDGRQRPESKQPEAVGGIQPTYAVADNKKSCHQTRLKARTDKAGLSDLHILSTLS